MKTLIGMLVGMVALGSLAMGSDTLVPRVEGKDEAGLRKLMGRKAVVFGKVLEVRDWEGNGGEGTGINFVNLEGGKFTLVCFERNYGKFKELPAVEMDGKYVEVVGVIKEYKGKLQIELTGPEQVKVVRVPDPPVVSGEGGAEVPVKGG
ncbi:MAG: hypothetical protein P8J87_11075, partial [Verrucomicrobiales bacterium]|nr:hypothetical protein [Verrucomicrobiales bacterium]